MALTLVILPASVFAIDAGAINKIVVGFARQRVSEVIMNPQVRQFMALSFGSVIALIFGQVHYFRSWSQGIHPLQALLGAFMAVAMLAMAIRIYDGATDAAWSFFDGLTRLIDQFMNHGVDPVALVTRATAIVHEDDSFGDIVWNSIRQVYIWTITIGIVAAQATMWLYLSGADQLFMIVKVVGFFMLPMALFKWSSKIATGAIYAMIFSGVLKMAAAATLSLLAYQIDRFLVLTGGQALDITTASYDTLQAVIGIFGPIVLVLLGLGGVAAMIVGGRDLSVDASGVVGGIAGGALGLLGFGARQATKRSSNDNGGDRSPRRGRR